MPKKKKTKKRAKKKRAPKAPEPEKADLVTGLKMPRMIWFWCIHCERAFMSGVPDDWKRGWFIEEVGKPYVDMLGRTSYECPYDGCQGTPIDFIPWADMREDDPSLPQIPECHKTYVPCYDGFPDLSGAQA
jgi:hypothetical protein